MSKKDQIIEELDKFPDKLVDEIFEYVKFLKEKLIAKNLETAIMSESSLKKDWFSPEEDEAWQDL
ncbi:MAG: DUF2281 domain-containing protein [Promethearchaeota archaeon]|nr:MAG: DUF2281 domain-containing protein [Candidatus Lokiarchaeota archaeon]